MNIIDELSIGGCAEDRNAFFIQKINEAVEQGKAQPEDFEHIVAAMEQDLERRINEIRVLVKKLEIRYGDQLLGTITISAGIAGTREHGGITMREFLHAADTALYAAKQAGRNTYRVVSRQEVQEPAHT